MLGKPKGEPGGEPDFSRDSAVRTNAERMRTASDVYDSITEQLDALGESDDQVKAALEMLAEPKLGAEDREEVMKLLEEQSSRAAELARLMEKVGGMIDDAIDAQGPAYDAARLAWARAESAARDARLAQELAAQRLEEIRGLLTEAAPLEITEEAKDVVDDVLGSDGRIPRKYRDAMAARAQRVLDQGKSPEDAVKILGQEAERDISAMRNRKVFEEISWSVK